MEHDLHRRSARKATAGGCLVRDEDVARLSPFIHERHINLLGRYSFTVPDAVSRGELRPLRILMTQMLNRVLRSVAP